MRSKYAMMGLRTWIVSWFMAAILGPNEEASQQVSKSASQLGLHASFQF
jgi:hypothetical protein